MIFGGLEKFTLIDYPGKTACLLYTIGCNFRCPYCHNPELVDETVETRILEEEVINFLKQRIGLLDGVVITGGEPTIHGEELVSFIRKIKDLGFLVKLDSNGTSPDILKDLVKNNLIDYIAMDIKCPIYKYSRIVARPVDIDKIKESIDFIMSSHVDYEFRTTVVKDMLSKDDIIKIGEEIKGARKYYFQRFMTDKILNPQLKRKVSYTDEEFEEFKKILEEKVDYCGIR